VKQRANKPLAVAAALIFRLTFRTDLSENGLCEGRRIRTYFGEEFTILKDRKKEIGRDLLAKMCRDLNIDPHDL
jgi:hypothetical protein